MIRAGRLLLLALGLLLAPALASAQTLNGVTIGGNIPASLPEPTRIEEVGNSVFLHWDLAPDIGMSIWAADDIGPVLSVQLARTAPHNRPESPLPRTQFGVTTTADLIARFGPPGPIYDRAGAGGTFGPITTHNLSWEIDTGDTVVTFITVEDINQPDTTGRDAARLDAIILADRAFQEVFWGRPSYPDQGYEPIPDPF